MISQQSSMIELQEDFVSSLKSMQEEEKTINIKTNSDLISARNFIGDYQQVASDGAIKLVSDVITNSFDKTKKKIKRRFNINQHDDNIESSDKTSDDDDDDDDDISDDASITGSITSRDSKDSKSTKGSKRSAFSSFTQKMFGQKPKPKHKSKIFNLDGIVPDESDDVKEGGSAIKMPNFFRKESSIKKTDDASKHDKLLLDISKIISSHTTKTLDAIPETIKELGGYENVIS